MKNCSTTKRFHSNFSAHLCIRYENRIPKTIVFGRHCSISLYLFLYFMLVLQLWCNSHGDRLCLATIIDSFLQRTFFLPWEIFPTIQCDISFCDTFRYCILWNFLAISINWCWKDIKIWLNFFFRSVKKVSLFNWIPFQSESIKIPNNFFYMW